MLGFWCDLPWWARLGIGVLIMGIGIVIIVRTVALSGAGTLLVDDPRKYALVIGFIVTGIGFGLICVGGKTDSEKNGYKF